MTRKLEIGIGVTGVVIALAAWLLPMPPSYISGNTVSELSIQREPFYQSLFPRPTLLVSGTGVRVRILMGPNDTEFSGGEISTTGSESTVYIKRGQKINLNLTGTGTRVFVQSGLMPYINVKNTATGGSVHEL
ncbi:MAG: hypothetical protein ACRBB3_09205 [Alphaproteobacteria bacterium]